jgi:nicotinate-nucleotide pyrophosphorylase (carboxylating)
MNDLVNPPLRQVQAIIQRALDEDVPWGDVTTDHSVPADQWSRAVLLAKQAGVLCGGRVFAETMTMVNALAKVDLLVPDGAAIARGDVLARLEGPTRGLLTAERTALNFV